MSKKNIKQKLEFLEEIEKFKKIERGNYFPDSERGETDAEHSWHLAMFLFVFMEDLPEGVDAFKLLKLALIHDLAEIYAGDAFFLTDEGKKAEKKEKEFQAAQKLFLQLPENLAKEYLELFEEYEARETTESQLVAVFDKIQAIHQNLSSGWLTYKKHNLSIDDILAYHKIPMEYNDLTKRVYVYIFEEAKNRGYIK